MPSAGWCVPDVAVATLRAQGITPVRGDLDTIASVVDAHRYDAVIDTATADHAPSAVALLLDSSATGKTSIHRAGPAHTPSAACPRL